MAGGETNLLKGYIKIKILISKIKQSNRFDARLDPKTGSYKLSLITSKYSSRTVVERPIRTRRPFTGVFCVGLGSFGRVSKFPVIRVQAVHWYY